MFEGDDDVIFPLFKPDAIEKLSFSIAQVLAPMFLKLIEPIVRKLQETSPTTSRGRIKRY